MQKNCTTVCKDHNVLVVFLKSRVFLVGVFDCSYMPTHEKEKMIEHTQLFLQIHPTASPTRKALHGFAIAMRRLLLVFCR